MMSTEAMGSPLFLPVGKFIGRLVCEVFRLYGSQSLQGQFPSLLGRSPVCITAKATSSHKVGIKADYPDPERPYLPGSRLL
jgi:hypothetical protein